MKHAVVVCWKCGTPQTKYYPLQNETCAVCKAPINEKNVIAILSSLEQAKQGVKNYKSEKQLLQSNRKNVNSLGLREDAIMMDVATKFRPEKDRTSYIRGDDEREGRKKRE
jgi:hypothetical protein